MIERYCKSTSIKMKKASRETGNSHKLKTEQLEEGDRLTNELTDRRRRIEDGKTNQQTFQQCSPSLTKAPTQSNRSSTNRNHSINLTLINKPQRYLPASQQSASFLYRRSYKKRSKTLSASPLSSFSLSLYLPPYLPFIPSYFLLAAFLHVNIISVKEFTSLIPFLPVFCSH